MPAAENLAAAFKAFECNEMSDDEMVEFFDVLVQSGMIDYLQGYYQDFAEDLQIAGLIGRETEGRIR